MLIYNKNNNRLITDILDDETNKKLNSYFDHVFEDYEYSFFDNIINYSHKDGLNVSYEFNSDDLPLPQELSYLVDLAYEYLTKNGFNVLKTRGTIDFWNYQINNDPFTNSLLEEHYDNEFLDDYKVHSCIFYTQKDSTFNGGNLYYFSESENSVFNILGIDQQKYLLPIESKMVVLMDGDLVHQPEPYCGTGIRNSIVVSLITYDNDNDNDKYSYVDSLM